MIDKPTLSVVMAAFNAEAYIVAAIESVLAQTFIPQLQALELIVVDDGSTDATAQRAAEASRAVTVLSRTNQGIFSALNTGIRAARHEWLAFIDSDDLWTPARLAKQFAAFEAEDAPDCLYGHVQNFYSPEMDKEYRARVICPPAPLPGIWHYTLLIRRADFLRVGPFATDWSLGGFMEWFSRANLLGIKYFVLSDVVIERRLHANNTGIRERSSQGDYARILKIILDRKRAANKT